jgi:fatty acid desaturase
MGSGSVPSSIQTVDTPSSNLNEDEKEVGTATYFSTVRDVAAPIPWIYWTDLILTGVLGYSLFMISGGIGPSKLLQFVCLFLSSVCLFRMVAFNHEIAHAAARVKGFSSAYNLIFGFFFKFPTYVYGVHRFHHQKSTYGTKHDSEYDDWGSRPRLAILAPLFTGLILPVFLFVRFGLLPPFLPFLGRRGRSWIYRYASTIAMNPLYQRPAPSAEETKRWYLQDAGCVLYHWALFAPMVMGAISWTWLLKWFVVNYLVFQINFYRVIVSHLYATRMQPSTYQEQILDTVTIEGPEWMHFWWAPLGLRYHTLHHMFPSLPYHSMRKAHEALLKALPAEWA